ncbi:MAG: hypothetical protein GY765_04860 [bacterium]|nr:hypothetical protein [bacterium]
MVARWFRRLPGKCIALAQWEGKGDRQEIAPANEFLPATIMERLKAYSTCLALPGEAGTPANEFLSATIM